MATMAANRSESALELLAPELKVQVLRNLDVQSLKYLVRASPIYHAVYRTARSSIFTAATFRTLHNLRIDLTAMPALAHITLKGSPYLQPDDAKMPPVGVRENHHPVSTSVGTAPEYSNSFLVNDLRSALKRVYNQNPSKGRIRLPIYDCIVSLRMKRFKGVVAPGTKRVNQNIKTSGSRHTDRSWIRHFKSWFIFIIMRGGTELHPRMLAYEHLMIFDTGLTPLDDSAAHNTHAGILLNWFKQARWDAQQYIVSSEYKQWKAQREEERRFSREFTAQAQAQWEERQRRIGQSHHPARAAREEQYQVVSQNHQRALRRDSKRPPSRTHPRMQD